MTDDSKVAKSNQSEGLEYKVWIKKDRLTPTYQDGPYHGRRKWAKKPLKPISGWFVLSLDQVQFAQRPPLCWPQTRRHWLANYRLSLTVFNLPKSAHPQIFTETTFNLPSYNQSASANKWVVVLLSLRPQTRRQGTAARLKRKSQPLPLPAPCPAPDLSLDSDRMCLKLRRNDWRHLSWYNLCEK